MAKRDRDWDLVCLISDLGFGVGGLAGLNAPLAHIEVSEFVYVLLGYARRDVCNRVVTLTVASLHIYGFQPRHPIDGSDQSIIGIERGS
ncbi:unnamed protein product [Cuscuta campestris]|uniref:Uncharacterized protein n=1 Tax=Cuscuta campestris TaxID=132261 RepID=A0A484MK68_9ASTE|nr:unnamed protein product [Cuscuta campestris]